MQLFDIQSTAEKYAYYREQATAIFGICPLTTSTTTSSLSGNIGSEPVQYTRKTGESSLHSHTALHKIFYIHLTSLIVTNAKLLIYHTSKIPGLLNLRNSNHSVTPWSHDVVSRAIRSTIPTDASDIEPRQYISWLCASSGNVGTTSSSAAQGM